MSDPREEAVPQQRQELNNSCSIRQETALLTRRVSTLQTVPGDVGFKNEEQISSVSSLLKQWSAVNSALIQLYTTGFTSSLQE